MLDLQAYLDRSREYLQETLLPFWMQRSPDPEYGGFLTWFGADGEPSGETTKTFLSQIRMLYVWSLAHRNGYGGGRCAELARDAADFLLEHYWDDECGGWFWIADRAGKPTCLDKVGYGQCFGMYAFAEYFLATGDPRGREAMERSDAAVVRNMADTHHGGYLEIMNRDWQPPPGARSGGDRKSFDVHMHMMEALTSVYEVTGHSVHRHRLLEVIDLIESKMLDSQYRTGIMQFALDFTPLGHIQFDVAWGKDEKPEDGDARPIDLTNYGHNVEYAWLLLHAFDVLGESRASRGEQVRPIFDHCLRFGLDEQYGGVFIEGPMSQATTNHRKQFWQQAEVMIGMLDAWALFDDDRYLEGFRNVHDFVFDKLICWRGGGEWYLLVDRDGTPIWDELGTGWKICYHTVRGMVEVIRRLEAAIASRT
ncbi:MAG: AGE family epimerase/isomerase [Planctomycetota bacterium]|nr:AGE family epimerase/isomerase [Planctomycetota bacterium]